MKKAFFAALTLAFLVPAGAVMAAETTVGKALETGINKTEDGVERAGEVASDSWITTKVKSLFVADHDVPSTKVSVKTKDGVVYLSGVVEDAKQLNRAVYLVEGVKGVKSVNSKDLHISRN